MYSFDRSKQNIALVVDDNPDSLGMVATALEDSGMTVLVARDGNAAIDLVGRIDPDVILMDAVMPELDGFETCRQLKSDSIQSTAPVVFMTGLSEPEHIVKGLKAGGVDYITKPVVIDELIARITIHIANSKMLQSARSALDSSGYMLLAFSPTGKLNWGSPKAVELYGGAASEMDPSSERSSNFRTWLHTCSSLPISQQSPFEMSDFTLRFVGISNANDALVKLSMRTQMSTEKILCDAFNLTNREAEVLYWLSLGKSNKDIAVILSLSARTVNKHLEQVFTKMGVDNRTSAAVMADRALHAQTNM